MFQFLFMGQFIVCPLYFRYLCYLVHDFLFLLFVTLVYALCCCVCVSFANVLLFPLCQAGNRLLQLERKVQALEQEKSLETTEGTLAYPKAKKLEFLCVLYTFIQVKSTTHLISRTKQL